jgi:hypothetical protein
MQKININKIIIYAFIGLILTLFVSCSISLVKGMKIPCANNDSYCWEGQSESMQKIYLN